MASDSPDSQGSGAPAGAARQPHRIAFVTGMLGAGKTTVLRELEDLGWEVIDNFPIRLIGGLVVAGEGQSQGAPPLAIGFDCRTRGFDPAQIIDQLGTLARQPDVAVTTLFLDCAGHELERRFDETRRRHHLAQDMLVTSDPVTSGIAAERELLGPLRGWAEMLIDTTNYSVNDLKQAIRERFGADAPSEMTVTVSSFGFSRGIPPAVDLLFDMRFLANPHWDPALRDLTGQDEPVGRHIEGDPAFSSTYGRIRDLITELLPRYSAQGKRYVNIAFGCTGGRHRSVFVAERMVRDLRETGFSPIVLHRNLASRTAEINEASRI